MTYRPALRPQLDGSACQSGNCNPASHAMAAQRWREGADPGLPSSWPPGPQAIRAWERAQYGVGCGGTTLAQNDAAVRALYNTDMLTRYDLPFASFRSLVISGRGAVVCISYAIIHGTAYDACPTFRGSHAVYVNERRASDGRFLVYDPLADGRRRGIPRGPQWWPASLLQRAAGAYPSAGPGLVHANFTRDTE